jgi:superfamily II DNA or RNA helicase
MNQCTAFSPGTLVSARGREWVVLAGSTAETLRVRPVSGSEEDQTLIHLPLEAQPVREARFPLPDAQRPGGHDAALLLRDALLLSTRRGAGPFRSFGQIAVEPRAYQLVPLLMALKLDPVRLLIADDVGVGKTIEAALILREMLDRGEIERSVVLCPPHLVEQWVAELEARFNLQTVAVTASSARRLERGIPPGLSLFQVHPHTVVSLDYIKSQERRAHFLYHCPDFVVVDEAHACVGNGQGQHQRYDLLRNLADAAERHMVLLTATPHSGDDAAFYRLLGLLDRSFEALQTATDQEHKKERDRLRERLGNHFVQRRRVDIAEWQDATFFPKRETRELTYKLTGAWETFFNAVLDYCAEIVVGDDGDTARQRVNFWGTLALLRCAASSPVAAALALRTHAGEELSPEARDELLDRLFDGDAESLVEDDVEPPAARNDPRLAALLAQAEQLAGRAGDPKLKVLSEHVEALLRDPQHAYHPVVFCRYISTAHYLGRHLKGHLSGVAVEVITGELSAEEREARIAKLGELEGPRVLVATDCLSEGINLQDYFDAVIHYDLSWNPTRHEQREGRVDRFGQRSPIVRATLMYGINNPVDGAVLDVILRKAERIRRELGVPVPVPDEGHSLTQALLKGVLLRRRGREVAMGEAKQLALFEEGWRVLEDKAKANRTLFAQRRLKPEDVLPEWNKTLAAIGGREDVQRFTDRALARFGAGLEAMRRGFKAPTASLPEALRERLEAEGLSGTLRIDFCYPAPPPCRAVGRSHPLVVLLAEALLERSLSDDADTDSPSVLGRVGCWVSDGVTARTTLALLRLRHRLVVRRNRRDSTLLVEEASGLAWVGQSARLRGTEALALLALPPVADVPPPVRARETARALALLEAQASELEHFAAERAEALLQDHLRVRAAAYRDERAETRERSVQVEALPRPDVIGVFVLLPKVA